MRRLKIEPVKMEGVKEIDRMGQEEQAGASDMKPYPKTICADCGDKYGNKPCGIATWHVGLCEICKRLTAVTEPRDFGYLKEGWEWKTMDNFL